MPVRLFAGRCARATREKSPPFEERDRPLAYGEKAQWTRRRVGGFLGIGPGAS